MPLVGKPEDSPLSGDPDVRLQELAEQESRIRGEIYEREQVLANITARKAKIQQTLQKADSMNQKGPTPDQQAALDRLQREGLVPNPNQMVRGQDGMVLPARLAGAQNQPVAPRLQVPQPVQPQPRQHNSRYAQDPLMEPPPPDPNEMVRGPDGLVLPRRLLR